MNARALWVLGLVCCFALPAQAKTVAAVEPIPTLRLTSLLEKLPAQISVRAAPDGSTWLADPLDTRPPMLDAAKSLPGDTTALACSPNALAPAEGSLQALTLAQAVDAALCHNPQVQGAWAAIKVQAAALGEAKAAYLPTLTASASRVNDQTRLPGSNVAPTTLDSNTLYGNLNWRLFDFGGRDAAKRSAEALLSAALAQHDALVQKTLSTVVAAYFDAQTQAAVWSARQKNEQWTQQTLQAVQRRQARGAAARSEVLQASTAWAKAALDKSHAQGAYRKAQSVLVYAMGLPASTSFDLAADVIDTSSSLRQDLGAWLEQTQTQHPTLMAARSQLEAAKNKVVSTRAQGLPTVDVSGSVYQNGRPNQALTSSKTQERLVSLTLNVPLFDGFAQSYKVRGAQAQVEQKQAELQDTEQQVLMEVIKAHADASAALDNLDASQNLLTAAQEALASMQRKFDRGAADTLEILNAQSSLADAQQERIRYLADWRSARLRLMAAAGALGRSAVAP